MKDGKGGGRPAGGRWSWKRVGMISLALNVLLILILLFSGSAGGGKVEEVDRAIDDYFRVWSVQDMDGYRDCFHPAAVIYFIDENGLPRPSGLEPFVEGQRLSHQSSKVVMREIPLEKVTEIDGNIARSRVRWKLFSERGEEVGTDYFTYLKTKNGWKIINLIFRKDG